MDDVQQILNRIKTSGDDFFEELSRVRALNVALEAQLQRKHEEKIGLQEEIAALKRAFTADIFQLLAANELAQETIRLSEAALQAEILHNREQHCSKLSR